MKNILSYLCLILITILQISNVSCQTGWTNYTNSQGIVDIEESESFLWIASFDGLAKVDLETNELKHFNRYNSVLPSNRVYDILLHPDGTLWVATSKGICTYRNNEFEISSDSGRSFTLTPDNKVAVIVGSVIRIYSSLNDYEEIVKPSEFTSASALHIDSEGTFYLATSGLFQDNDIISYKNGEWNVILPNPGIANNYLAIDGNDRLWLYNHDGLKYYINNTWQDVALELDNPGRIHKIEIDVDDNIYLYENNTNCNKLYKWDGLAQSTVEYRKDDCQHTHFVKASSLESDLFYAVHRINGYYTFTPEAKGAYTYISQSPLYSNQVKASYQYSDGRKIIVARKNIQIYDQGEWSYLPELPDFEDQLLHYAFVNDVLWVSDTKTIWSYENENWTKLDIPSDISSIEHLAVGENGDVWVSRFFTLYRYRNLEWTTYNTVETGISNGGLQEILVQQATNDLWVLHKFNGGVYHFNDTDWTFYEIPEFLTLHNISSTPSEIFVQAEENLYSITNNQLMFINSLPEGLFDGIPQLSTDETGERLFITDFGILGIYEDGILNTYTTENSGIYSSYTNHISLDENDHIWLSGESGGIAIFDPLAGVNSIFDENISGFSELLEIYPTITEGEYIHVIAKEDGIYSTTLTDMFGRTISHSNLFLHSGMEQRINLPSNYLGAMFITFTRNGRIQTNKILKL